MISLEQGVEIAWHAFEDMVGGEIYVKKIPSMKVTDVARAIAPDASHDIVGIRPGEKLHEELFHSDENLTDTSHEKVMLAMSRKTDWPTLVKSMDGFQQAVDEFDMKGLKKLICKLVPEMTQQHTGNKTEGDNAA